MKLVDKIIIWHFTWLCALYQCYVTQRGLNYTEAPRNGRNIVGLSFIFSYLHVLLYLCRDKYILPLSKLCYEKYITFNHIYNSLNCIVPQ